MALTCCPYLGRETLLTDPTSPTPFHSPQLPDDTEDQDPDGMALTVDLDYMAAGDDDDDGGGDAGQGGDGGAGNGEGQVSHSIGMDLGSHVSQITSGRLVWGVAMVHPAWTQTH